MRQPMGGMGNLRKLELQKCERVFCEIPCKMLCDWLNRRCLICRLPVAVVLAATGAVCTRMPVHVIITRRIQRTRTKKHNSRIVQWNKKVCRPIDINSWHCFHTLQYMTCYMFRVVLLSYAVFVMVTLCNRADHYIFILFLLSSSSFFFLT